MLQSCISPVWDTALVLQAMQEAAIPRIILPWSRLPNGCLTAKSGSRETGKSSHRNWNREDGHLNSRMTGIPMSMIPQQF